LIENELWDRLSKCKSKEEMWRVERDFLEECEQVSVWNLPFYLLWRLAKAHGLQDESDERVKLISCYDVHKVRKLDPEHELYYYVCKNYDPANRSACLSCIAGSVEGAKHFDDGWLEAFVREIKRRKRVAKARLEYHAYEIAQARKSKNKTPTV